MKLKFRYQRLPGDPIIKATLKPYLVVTFFSPDKSKDINIFGLLDSGADGILVPIEVADLLNIPAKKEGKLGKAMGIGAQIEKLYCLDGVRMQVVGELNTLSLSVCFMENQQVALLGRTFFEQYKSISFLEDKKEVRLEQKITGRKSKI